MQDDCDADERCAGQAGAKARSEEFSGRAIGAESCNIEISPEMTAAGVKAFLAWEKSSNPYSKSLVQAIYRAMKAEEPLLPPC